MINIAILGKRGSGKTSFLLNALAPIKIGGLDDVCGGCQYVIMNEDEQKIYSKKLKILQKGNDIEQTNGVNETIVAFCSEEEKIQEVTFWELGGVTLEFSKIDFESQLSNCFTQMFGGKKGIDFDGYIFFEDAQNFGISEDISYLSFSHRFSEYLDLADRVKKPVLLLCTKRHRRLLEQSLFARFQDNFKLDILAHYAFFDFEWKERESVVNSKYILSKFLEFIAENSRRSTLGKRISLYNNNLKSYTTLYKGMDENE